MSKAPDKIYIEQDMINNIPLERQYYEDDVIYIRKDALLKWANGMSKAVATLGEELSFRELIEHIKSL